METLVKKATVEDYRQLPEGADYQLIAGEIIPIPSPTSKHQKIAAEVFRRMANHIFENKMGVVLFAPMDVYLDEENVYQPDILFVAAEKESIIREDGIHGSPDLIVEILSPSTSYYDTKNKFRTYEKYGVQEYWLLDPADNEAIGYEWKSGKFHEFYRAIGKMKSQVLALEVSLA